MRAYRQRTGERMTYELLAERTGLSRSSLESIGARPQYNVSLSRIAYICVALGCTPAELLELEVPATSRARRRPR